MTWTAERLSRLIDRHAAALELFAAQWTHSPADAVQEAFIRLVTEKPEPDNVAAWLYRVVRFRAINMSRAETRRRRHEASAALLARQWFVPGPAEGLEAEETVAALGWLPAEQRETIVARIWGGLSFREIASVTHTSISTSHRRYQEGIDALRKRLEPTWQTTTTSRPKL